MVISIILLIRNYFELSLDFLYSIKKERKKERRKKYRKNVKTAFNLFCSAVASFL